MITYFSAFNDLVREDPVYWFCALSGSLLFVGQFCLSFLGAQDDLDEGGGDPGKVKWLSKQALTGFLMMFGWVGLTCKKELHLSHFWTVLFGVLAGVLALLATALIFRLAKKLCSPGVVFDLENAIGKEAVVYQRIPKGGIGKISLCLHDLTYEVDAVSHEGEEVDSFTQVQIIKKSDEKTAVIVPIK